MPSSPGSDTGTSDGDETNQAAAGAPRDPRGDDLLQTVFEQAPLGMVLFDSRLHIFRANAAFADMLGSTPDRLVGRSLLELIDPRDRDHGRAQLRRLEKRELTWITVQQRCPLDDGQIRWCEFATRIFWDATGAFQHGMGIVRDVTELVTAGAALRESEIRNWRIAESNMMGLVEWRDAVTVSEANDAFLQMLGYTREDLRSGRIRWDEILPPDARGQAARMRQELLTTGRIHPTRVVYRSRGGQTIPVLAGGARISAEPLRGIGFVLDMTEQVKTEEERAKAEAALRSSIADLEQAQAQLQLADRMASMGTLAAGVAHEINNPLGFVVANLGFAQDELAALKGSYPDPATLDRRLTALTWALAEAQEGASRVRNIVLDLRTFSHPDAQARSPVDLRRVINSAVNMAQGEIRGRARIVRRFEAIPPVLGNEARLSQLFLNLVVNAAHAISAAGRPEWPSEQLDEAATDRGAAHAADGVGGRASLPPHQITLSVGLMPNGLVQAEVSDTGVGIAAEYLARIFDPFFTTKPIGRGTGLGLSICHEIVQSLGGDITASSTLGVGSTFRVVLPPAPDLGGQESSEPTATTSPVLPRSRPVRVLVVDDEPLMGSAISRVLAEYEVVALTSARVAMARIAGGEQFDVILCDVMMPDFSGIDLYRGLALEAPGLLDRLVFITGGAYTTEAVEFLEQIPNARLEKPILPQALHAAVATVVDAIAKREE